MKKIISEIIIPLHDVKHGILAESVIKIRLGDQGAGPYLCIEGINSEPDSDESGHEFFLCSIEQIDEFAEICKEMIRGAE